MKLDDCKNSGSTVLEVILTIVQVQQKHSFWLIVYYEMLLLTFVTGLLIMLILMSGSNGACGASTILKYRSHPCVRYLMHPNLYGSDAVPDK